MLISFLTLTVLLIIGLAVGVVERRGRPDDDDWWRK